MTTSHPAGNRFVVIHGHFYQPPRENPWLGIIEEQDSSHPHHDWTERITEECYRANAFSPLLADGRRIEALVNNFEYLSFNVGPTLISWLEQHAPEVYRKIIEADRQSRKRCGGHGNAIAQSYNHTILPLATRRDKKTQILWGLRDFEFRFGRRSEGIWLPETAVDLETLSVLVECGVRFVVLSPSQLEAVRPLSGDEWEHLGNPGDAVHRQPYRIFPEGRGRPHLDVFFFHRQLSQAISFEHLLRDGKAFADRIDGAFAPEDSGVQSILLATDGETFGHHEKFGNMCLSYYFRSRGERGHPVVTNLGHILDLFPPTREARLRKGPGGEGTAWSCSHGVGRWYRNCGCSTGADPGWNQKWRRPMRRALNHVRKTADDLFVREGSQLLTSPWKARDRYVDVLLDPSKESRNRFLEETAIPNAAADPASRRRIFRLLEMQYYSQLMHTSCGWFFSDISGLEPVQNLLYARRAAEVMEEDFGVQVEPEMLRILEQARSNVRGAGSGARIYRRKVLPRRVSREELVAGVALMEMLGIEAPLDRSCCLLLEKVEVERIHLDEHQVETGWCRLGTRTMPEPEPYIYLVIRFSSTRFRATATAVTGTDERAAYRELRETAAGSTPRKLLRRFSWCHENASRLPLEFRLRLAEHAISAMVAKTSQGLAALFRSGHGLIRFDRESRLALSEENRLLSSIALSALFAEGVRRTLLEQESRHLRQCRRALKLAAQLRIPMDRTRAEREAARIIGRQLDRLPNEPTLELAERIRRSIDWLKGLEADLPLDRELQITYWQMLTRLEGHRLRGDGPRPEDGVVSQLIAAGENLGYHRESAARRLTGEVVDAGERAEATRVSKWQFDG